MHFKVWRPKIISTLLPKLYPYFIDGLRNFKDKIMSSSTKSKSDDPVLLHQLQGLKDAVHDICWDPKNKKIAAASNDTSVYLWDMANQNIRAYK